MQHNYNGWANRETWNVALWLLNDEPLYRLMSGYETYEQVRLALRELDIYETPDGVSFNDSVLDTGELDDLVSETHHAIDREEL